MKEPAPSDLSTTCKCVDVLTGSTTFVDGGKCLPGLGKEAGGGFIVKFVVGNYLEKKDENYTAAKPTELPEERSAIVKMEESI